MSYTVSPNYLGDLSPAELAALIQKGASVERLPREDRRGEIKFTVRMDGDVIGTCSVKSPLVGEVLSEVEHVTTERVWRSAQLSPDERISYPAGYENVSVTHRIQMIRFPNGTVLRGTPEGHAFVSALVCAGDQSAIDQLVEPVKFAGALPSSEGFDERQHARAVEAYRAERAAEQARQAAEAAEIEAAHAKVWETLSPDVKASEWVNPEDFSTEELLRIAALAPERQLWVACLNGRKRAKALRQEEEAQQGNFNTALGSRAAGIDLSAFGLE